MTWITNNGYRLIAIRVDGKRKLVLEHRYVMEQYIGRTLASNEFVHHKDGDRLNNTIANLAVMDGPEHSRMHYPDSAIREWSQPGSHTSAGIEVVAVTCEQCGITIVRQAKHARRNAKRGSKTMCSPKCRAAYAGKIGRAKQLESQ